MDEIVKKLTASGVSSDMVEKLKSGLGNTFETEIMTSGLKAAAAKVGIDTTDLPDIDFKDAMAGVQELMGKDVDGDGKTGISEAVDSFKKVAANTDMAGVQAFAQKNAGGIMTKIKGFLGV
jgi:hypothetical protein